MCPFNRFKLPVLRGEVDVAVDKYRAIETTYAKDLDTWLANLYLEVQNRFVVVYAGTAAFFSFRWYTFPENPLNTALLTGKQHNRLMYLAPH
jgi:hypothetical protein